MSELKITTLQEFRRAALRGAWRGMVIQGGAVTARWRHQSSCCTVGWLIPNASLPGYQCHVDVHRMPTYVGSYNEALEYIAPPLKAWINVSSENRDLAREDLRTLQSAHDVYCSGYAENPGYGVFQELQKLAIEWNVDLPLDEYPALVRREGWC